MDEPHPVFWNRFLSLGKTPSEDITSGPTRQLKKQKNEKFKGFLPDAFLTLLSTGGTMPVGQLENITEGVSAAVDTGGTASNSNCKAQISEAVIDGETNPVGQSTSVSE